MSDDSEFVGHEACPKCGSSDALARYTDGHGYCFSCGHHERGDGEVEEPKQKRSKVAGLIPVGEYKALTKRKLTLESVEKWGYTSSKYKGEGVQVANYYDPTSRQLIGQKVRTKDKDFVFLGGKKPPLYGMWLWRDKAPKIVITEGEIDAITVSQLQKHRWPVVSVPTGAKGAKKALQRHLDWLDKFGEVVLMFDNDEEGNAAVAECAPLFSPGKCKVARLPLKDANDMLVAGRGDEVIAAIWEAKAYRPDGIVTLTDIRERIRKPPEQGLPWWSPTLTRLTFGRQWGKVYILGAGTGIGKTDFLTQQMEYDVNTLKQAVGIFSFEQPPEETGKRIAGKFAGKTFHIPDGSWKQEELDATLDEIEKRGAIYLYDSFGSTEWDTVRAHIRWLHHNHGVRIFYIDNLTAFAAESEDEKKMLEQTMAQIAKIAMELQIIIHLVSHLSTPEGTPHEEGGRVMIRHFKGSRAIGYWGAFMFGMERNTQAEEAEDRKLTTFRVLKDRHTGRSTGEVFYLTYDTNTAKLVETDKPAEAKQFGLDKTEDDF